MICILWICKKNVRLFIQLCKFGVINELYSFGIASLLGKRTEIARLYAPQIFARPKALQKGLICVYYLFDGFLVEFLLLVKFFRIIIFLLLTWTVNSIYVAVVADLGLSILKQLIRPVSCNQTRTRSFRLVRINLRYLHRDEVGMYK